MADSLQTKEPVVALSTATSKTTMRWPLSTLMFCSDALALEWKRSKWSKVVMAVSLLITIASIFIVLPTNPIPSWSGKVRVIILLSSLVLTLLVTIEAVVRLHVRKAQQMKCAHEELKEFLRPQLDIQFIEDGKGFVHAFQGEALDRQGLVEWKLYRVAVTSRSTSPWTRLKVDEVTLKDGKTTFTDLFLRIMGRAPLKTQTQLHRGVPQEWDVVEKPIGSDWIRLTHAEQNLSTIILQVPYQFRITASCDQGFGISKLVTLNVDPKRNNELIFELSD